MVRIPTRFCGLYVCLMYAYSLGQLIKIIRETHMEIVVDKLIAFFSSKEDELRDISGLGTRSFVSLST